jgi:hypothetical protein
VGQSFSNTSAAAVLGLTLLLSTGCYIDTQRHPRPMGTPEGPLPPGSIDQYPPGPEEVLIVRHSDPVQIRHAGRAQSTPLTFYRKTERARAGSWASCGSGGRLEVLWPNGTSIVLFGEGCGVIGSPSRGEPTFILQHAEHVTLNMHPDDRVQLMGGAVLLFESGPIVIEHVQRQIVRIRNRSTGVGRVAYRDQVFDLDPGHLIDLPLLSAGSSPFQPDPGFQVLGAPGLQIEVRGEVEVLDEDLALGETRVRATGDHELRAFGARFRLNVGDELLFAPVGHVAPTPAGEDDSSPPEPSDPGGDPATQNMEDKGDPNGE